MFKKGGLLLLFFLLSITYTGCEGIRHSYVAPEAKELARGRLAIIPADVGIYPEAKGEIEKMLLERILATKIFSVVSAESITRGLKEEAKEQLLADYMAKLRILNYSDPELSRKIGETWAVDVFLISFVEYWGYSMDKDDKIAKVGLTLNMIDAKSGQIIWKAVHYEKNRYRFIKPSLTNVARELVKKMIENMPASKAGLKLSK